MIWTDDDTPQRVKRPAGRPEVNPFPSPEVEEDFARRGRRMLDLYWRDVPGSKSNIYFDDEKRMSKTLFWSMVYLYYVMHKKLRRNVQGYWAAVQRHFGSEVAGDRGAIAKKVTMLRTLSVQYLEFDHVHLSKADDEARRRNQAKYRIVIKRWEAVDVPPK